MPKQKYLKIKLEVLNKHLEETLSNEADLVRAMNEAKSYMTNVKKRSIQPSTARKIIGGLKKLGATEITNDLFTWV